MTDNEAITENITPSFYWATFDHFQLLHCVCVRVCVCARSPFTPPSSEKEAEKIKERLAQEEAEAMEMEDEENKAENANNDKDVCEESSYQAEPQKNFLCRKIWNLKMCCYDHI